MPRAGYWESRSFLGLATAVVVVTLAALIGVRVVKCTLTVTARALPPVVSVDEPAVLELTIEAPGGAGSLSVPVTLQTDHSLRPVPHQPTRIIVPRLVRDGRAMARFAISTERRGLVDAGGYEAVISDPLGLAVRRVSASRPTRCVVLPRIEALASVLPEGLGRTDAESALSLAERPITASSMLRPYAHGDDLRSVHWRTTARVGKLMVRDGGDRDEPDRIATTVLLEVGDGATLPDELDRAVEVAASVLSAAADESGTGVSGTYRLVTTAGLDTGAQRGQDALQNVLIAIAAVAPAPTPVPGRFSAAVARSRSARSRRGARHRRSVRATPTGSRGSRGSCAGVLGGRARPRRSRVPSGAGPGRSHMASRLRRCRHWWILRDRPLSGPGTRRRPKGHAVDRAAPAREVSGRSVEQA